MRDVRSITISKNHMVSTLKLRCTISPKKVYTKYTLNIHWLTCKGSLRKYVITIIRQTVQRVSLFDPLIIVSQDVVNANRVLFKSTLADFVRGITLILEFFPLTLDFDFFSTVECDIHKNHVKLKLFKTFRTQQLLQNLFPK